MAIWMKGIWLEAHSLGELHEMAGRFVISKSWYSSWPSPHYEIVSPHKMDDIMKYIERRGKG